MTDRPDTEAIAARAEAATPGKWEATIVRPGVVIDLAGRVVLATVCQGWQGDKTIHVTTPEPKTSATPRLADAEFIAHARQDIPILLAALATAEERAEAFDEQGQELVGQLNALETRLAAAEAVVEAAERAEGVLRKTFTVALTVKPTLDEPYKDDPRWTPWTRWVEPVARRSHDLHLELKKLLANYHKATGPQAETEEATKNA